MKITLVISLLLLGVSLFSVNITPTIVFQDGIESDTILTQELFKINDFQFNIGFNLKRFGFDIGYQTPYLMKSITIHTGVFHKWSDLNRQFTPAFGIGISIKF